MTARSASWGSSARRCSMLTSLDCAGSVNVSEHSVPDVWRRISAEFTKTVRDNPHGERILRLLPVVLLTIRGKCAGFRAKIVQVSGHLPTGFLGGWSIPLPQRSNTPIQPVRTASLALQAYRSAITSLQKMIPFVACVLVCTFAYDTNRGQKMHKALEPEVFALLCDLNEHAPHLTRLLIFVEPTKTLYGCLGRHIDPTQTLARGLQAFWASASETCISGKAQPTGFSPHSSREIPRWQAFEQGGRSPHATASLSD